MFFTQYLLFSLLSVVSLSDHPSDSTKFISPLKIQLSLSSDFGELRVDHFHSGIDIKTDGVTGKEVVAAADGYVYWIGVTPGGYGNVLHVSHSEGYSTVYGHLEKFTPELDEYVKEKQYEAKSFTVSLWPPVNKFRFKQGDVIAYSGNSGGSSGPHLHFEIRKTATETPINPLLFDFGVADNIKPVMERLFIYPLGKNSTVEGAGSVKKITLEGNNGKYSLPGNYEISISGSAGFGIKTYDLFNNSNNRGGIYSIELRVDSSLKFAYTLDAFDFSESRYINSHIDYETYVRDNTFIERTFVLPNDRLSVYHHVIDRGIFRFTDGKVHHVEIAVADMSKNRSVLEFDVKSIVPDTASVSSPREGVMMPYSRSNRFRAPNISLLIPSGALYDTIWFMYKKGTGTSQMLSDVHYIHNKYTPLQKAIVLSIKPSIIPAGKESKLLLVQLSDNFRKSAVASSFSDGYVTGSSLSFGMFYVGIDTVPPVILANGLKQNPDMTGKSSIRIRITDDLSGIKSYEPSVDGNWALFEYDLKYDLLTYRFDPKRIEKGKEHQLTLKVTDNKDNTSVFSCNFRW